MPYWICTGGHQRTILASSSKDGIDADMRCAERHPWSPVPGTTKMLYLCLIVQRDNTLAEGTNRGLAKLGIKSYHVTSLSSALALLAQWRFDVVLFDSDGFGDRVPHTLAELGQFGLPIAMISSAPQEEQAEIRTLELGATEVVTRPSSIHLTALRLRKLAEIRRGPANDERPAQICLGPLALETRRMSARVGGEPLELTPRQFDLLLLLTSKAGEFVHRQTIATTLRLRGDEGSRSIDMMVSRIRRRLRDIGDARLAVHTIYGQGYCLTFDDASANVPERDLRWCA